MSASNNEIAELTGKQHSNILADIRNIIERIDNQIDGAELNFQLSEYKDSTSRTLPMYILTKKEH